MASACVGDYIEVRDEAMTELLADGYGPVVTSNDLGICSVLLSSYFAVTREVKYVSLRLVTYPPERKCTGNVRAREREEFANYD